MWFSIATPKIPWKQTLLFQNQASFYSDGRRQPLPAATHPCSPSVSRGATSLSLCACTPPTVRAGLMLGLGLLTLSWCGCVMLLEMRCLRFLVVMATSCIPGQCWAVPPCTDLLHLPASFSATPLLLFLPLLIYASSKEGIIHNICLLNPALFPFNLPSSPQYNLLHKPISEPMGKAGLKDFSCITNARSCDTCTNSLKIIPL